MHTAVFNRDCDIVKTLQHFPSHSTLASRLRQTVRSQKTFSTTGYFQLPLSRLFCIEHLYATSLGKGKPTHATTSLTLSLTFKGIGIVLKDDTLTAGWLGECTYWSSQACWLCVFYFEKPTMPTAPFWTKKKLKRKKSDILPPDNTLNTATATKSIVV